MNDTEDTENTQQTEDGETGTTPAESTSTALPGLPAAPHHGEQTVELNAKEARVLGCLIEKSYLTPDVYPMTTKGLVTACNQKTSRDPVVAYDGIEIDAALLAMRQRNLVRRVHVQGARSTKHRHALDEILSVTEQQLVLLSVLLLRGDQTAGELRTRTDRHQVFDDGAGVQECLESLMHREPALVIELPRQPGHKDTRWRHLLGDGSPSESPVTGGHEPSDHTLPDHDPHTSNDSQATTESSFGTIAPPAAPPTVSVTGAATAPSPEAPAAPLTPAAGERKSFADRVDDLEAEVATLRTQLQDLAASLGEELS